MAETKNKAVQQAQTAEQPQDELMQQTVHIKLPKTRELTEDVWVGINGRSWLIQRGVDVEVPVPVARVLERKEEMLQIAMEYEARAAAPVEQMDRN